MASPDYSWVVVAKRDPATLWPGGNATSPS